MLSTYCLVEFDDVNLVLILLQTYYSSILKLLGGNGDGRLCGGGVFACAKGVCRKQGVAITACIHALVTPSVPLRWRYSPLHSELHRETTLKPSLTYPLRWQATFALRRVGDDTPLARHELTFSQFYKYLATPP